MILMCAYAGDVLAGVLPGPYRDEDAEPRAVDGGDGSAEPPQRVPRSGPVHALLVDVGVGPMAGGRARSPPPPSCAGRAGTVRNSTIVRSRCETIGAPLCGRVTTDARRSPILVCLRADIRPSSPAASIRHHMPSAPDATSLDAITERALCRAFCSLMARFPDFVRRGLSVRPRSP